MGLNFRWIGMSEDGESIHLKKFAGEFEFPSYATDHWITLNQDKVRKGLVLDLETTGFDRKSDQIIEIGMRPFLFHRETGELLRVNNGYSALNDPKISLSPEIVRLTGIRDEDVAGQEIRWEEVERILLDSDIVIAHNAQFDRPFLETKVSASSKCYWGCSAAQIDWRAKGFPTAKLEVLTLYHGFFTNAHRALSDVDALLHLLSMEDAERGKPYLLELLENAKKPVVKLSAARAPFESKDLLRKRGYRWNNEVRCWMKTLSEGDSKGEISWLEQEVYHGAFLGQIEEIPLNERFRSGS